MTEHARSEFSTLLSSPGVAQSPATLLVAGSVWEALLSAVGRLIFSSTEFGHHVTLTSSRKPCIHKVEKSQS